MAKIKAKITGYDTPPKGPKIKLQIDEIESGQKFVVDSRGASAKVDVWNESSMDQFFEHKEFSDLIAQAGNTAATAYDTEQFGALLVSHVDYIEFHTERKTVEKDENVFHNYALIKVDSIVLKGTPSQEKVVSISKEKDNTYNLKASIGQAINLAFQRAEWLVSQPEARDFPEVTFKDYLDKAYNQLMPWIFEKQGLELPNPPKEEEKTIMPNEEDVVTQDNLW